MAEGSENLEANDTTTLTTAQRQPYLLEVETIYADSLSRLRLHLPTLMRAS